MNFLLYRSIFRVSEAAQKFTIVNNRYLVPAPPKKGLSSYILFSNEQRAKQTGNIIEVASKIGDLWKTLPQNEKQKYVEQSKKLSEKFQAVRQEYQSKYSEPFKRISANNLAVKRVFAQKKPKDIKEGSELVKEYLKNLTEQQKQKLKSEAEAIRKQRQKTAEKFLIPEAEFLTERSFMLKHKPKGKSLSQLTDHKRMQLKHKYQEYIENYNKKLGQFAKAHGLTLEELQEVIKAHQRSLKREESSDATLSILKSPAKPNKTLVKRKRSKSSKKDEKDQ